MKPWKRTNLVILAVITVLSLILSACELIDNGNGNRIPAREGGCPKE